jgi:hypothetical protein
MGITVDTLAEVALVLLFKPVFNKLCEEYRVHARKKSSELIQPNRE